MRPVRRRLLVIVLCAAGCGARQESRPPTAAAPARSAERPRAAAAPTAAEATAVAAPGKEPAAPPAGQQAVFLPTTADQVFVNRMLAVLDEVAAVMERHQDACDRMATDLENLFRRNQDLLFMGKQMKRDPARDKWMQDQALGRLEKAIPRMMPGLQKCQGEPRMQALMRQLNA